MLTDVFSPFADAALLTGSATAAYIGYMSLANSAGRLTMGPLSDATSLRFTYMILGLQASGGGLTRRPVPRSRLIKGPPNARAAVALRGVLSAPPPQPSVNALPKYERRPRARGALSPLSFSRPPEALRRAIRGKPAA